MDAEVIPAVGDHAMIEDSMVAEADPEAEEVWIEAAFEVEAWTEADSEEEAAATSEVDHEVVVASVVEMIMAEEVATMIEEVITTETTIMIEAAVVEWVIMTGQDEVATISEE